MENIFIIGAGSQDGKILYNKLKGKYSIIKIYRNSYVIKNNKKIIDIKRKTIFNSLLKKYQPKEIYYFLTYQVNTLNRKKNNYNNFNKYLEINFEVLHNYLDLLSKDADKFLVLYSNFLCCDETERL